ncbi:hypothetical protein GNF10_30625 [Nostoc sp. UCD121]|uniref:hypothetical protein n=1 Tax=unclassified Nostoc TaxID=2593658 RepID=UPI0013D36104|nr:MULTISPECIES: hypothetical protein [unclassified Nostoc]MBC1221770.1 hypothetical protein [Nostoc sp. UCD120]MBC1280187.1 hypothetical protein [Nostoc sp. UCD121]MBC1300129.1 hypothetical protein [Nostoc sp. UCD122]NEU81958.1 hypothetical protein [Nostoc sp. UIC 10630]
MVPMIGKSLDFSGFGEFRGAYRFKSTYPVGGKPKHHFLASVAFVEWRFLAHNANIASIR